ncbi:hypothetical protein NECHADRAFT_102143 [Paecilomyces variotii No. 5]|uniref:SnoaL-like domain-containing protein n=1 Tax=Byssochlamys spectabilis (strain No. 5 / NBRC 109023) TaxID=1356009 RepID=V5FP44_BYSSN|nr:hypothetical protein NECHADRAFT_102143 [Paecilomyces variotii No. 5]
MTVPFEISQKIHQKKAQYGRYIDTKQWDKFDQVALPDADLTFLDTNGSLLSIGNKALAFQTPKQFTNFFRRFFANAQTLHMFGPGDLQQTGVDEVKAIWSMEDQIIMKYTGGLAEIRGGGFYFETWKLKDGDWFLQSLRLERTYTKISLLARVLDLLQTYLRIPLF